MSEVCIIVARVAPRRAWPDKTTPVVDLVLPYDPANYGKFAVWDSQGGHGEAAFDYYFDTKPPRTPAERAAAEAAVKAYRRCYGSDCTIVERQRRPADWREHAWRARA